MIYTIEISKQADIDLRNIYEYIAFFYNKEVRQGAAVPLCCYRTYMLPE